MTTRKEKVSRRKSDPGTLSFRPVQERTTVAAELPWGASKVVPLSVIDYGLPTGVFVGQSLLLELFSLFEKKLQAVVEDEPIEKLINKSLQRGGDAQLDNLCRSIASISELCLPSVLDALLKWHKRIETQVNDKLSGSAENKPLLVKKALAINYLFCIVLIEVLSQLEFHLATCELYLKQILELAFKNVQYRDPITMGQNHMNSLIVAEIYSEVIGVISNTRFSLIHRYFGVQLAELRKDTSSISTHQLISLLMAMKFVKIKTNQVDEFEVGIKFLDDLAGFFLEVKDKDVKHAAAGLLVEILLPIAAQIKREANIPALITFVGRLYTPTNELASKKQHKLAAYPLLTCLLCVSQRNFFLTNWVPFLNNALANLKNRDSRISRVALESLYRLLWVYMIRNSNDSNTSTRTRLESICGSLFPRGNRSIVPRDAPLNIFVKIIHFIAQQKLDFAFKDVIFDLLCCNRSQRTIYPERMNIGLRALMVIADGLQQKDEPPAMPKSMGPSASGTIQRIKKKTYITRPLTVDVARSLGLEQYYVPCRKALDSILRILDTQVGKPMMLTVVQKGKDVEELLGGDVKPKLDLYRTCVAAIPRLLPEPMSYTELIEIVIRLTIHMDEELRNLSTLTLQTMLNEFPDWRETVITTLLQLIHSNITDFYPTVLDDSLRLLLQLIGVWKQNAISEKKKEKPSPDGSNPIPLYVLNYAATLHSVEGLALVMLCQKRMAPRKIAISLLKEVKNLITVLALDNCETPVINVLDEASPYVIKKYIDHVPQADRLNWPTDFASIVEKISSIELDNNLINVDRGNEYLQWDPWACALSGYSEKQFLLSKCPTATAAAWPMLFSRLVAVNAHVDPSNPQNESRASLLRSSRNKTSSVYGEVLSQDGCLSLWQKYLVLCCAFAPPSINTASLASRSFSPTASVESDVLRSVSSSLRGFRAANNTMSLSQLLMKVSVMLRWENMTDIRDSVVLGIGSLNPLSFDSMLDELNQRQILRDTQEKRPDVRRKKRKDLLRLQLIRLFEVAVWRGALQSNLIDSSGHLNPLLLEFIDSMRIILETDPHRVDKDQDRDQVVLTSLRLHFAKLVALIVESVPPERRSHLIPDDKKQSLFYMFLGWCSRTIAGDRRLKEGEVGNYVEQKSVLAMTRILCCGPIFEPLKSIGEDGYLYGWLEKLVSSTNITMQVEVEEMLALMLDLNESSFLVDWLINQCYSQTGDVSARCFRALVRAFSRRDFPCEFVSLFVLCQAMSADPEVVDVAVHMIELLKKQFLDANSTICSPITSGSPSQVVLRGAPTPTFHPTIGHCYPMEQETVCRNLSKLYPHLSITIFSEVSYRLESAKHQNRGHLLSLLLPWIENLELVDAATGDDSFEGPRGWGSEEATQLLLNNLMHLTASFSIEHEIHIGSLWKALAVSFPANLPAILNYLYALILLSHETLLPYAKRICVLISGAVGNRLASLLLEQLTTSGDQSKLSVERVEIAPYYRWKDDSLDKRDFTNDCLIATITNSQRTDETQQEGVRLLPMPAYGGHYSSLSQFLPPASQALQFFTRSQVGLLLITDLIRATTGDVDWTEATPRLLHSSVLNLDSLRPVLCRHARKVVINVCLLYADASTYSQVSAILLKNQMSLTTTEPFLRDVANLRNALGREFARGESPTFSRVAEEEYRQMLLHSNALFSSHSDLIKAVVFCLSENMDRPLWPNEDATSRNWKVPSANQLSCLVRHLAAELFLGPLPLLPVVWTQMAMRMALATPQRHLAGRCFQIVSSLCQSPCAWIPSLISRLVETAGEQHEETQAYVTDLLVCLLHSASTLSGVVTDAPPLSCASPTHARSTSYTPALLRQSMINQRVHNDRKDARLSLLVAEEQPWTAAALVRSKSAEQLKSDTDSDEEATARVQMCAIAVALLDSNLENEFNLALCLLEKILGTAGVHKVPCVQKLEKTIQQLEWKGFQNIVSLVVRGAIVPMAIEPSLQMEIQLLELLDESVVGGRENFGLVISHMLPFLLLNFEAPTLLCTEISSAVDRYCKSVVEKTEGRTVDHPFNHLATVMIQYSTKTFTKDRWQWTKCVVQYVCEGLDKTVVTPMLVYLAEVLDRGPQAMVSYILHILYLLINQRDPSDPPLPVNAQVARVVSRHVQGSNWREASRVYKAIVEQWQNTERDKPKESDEVEQQPSFELDIEQIYGEGKSPASPRKNAADSSLKRQAPPHIRVRDRLVALLSASGLRVGLPSAQSVVFSQSELGSAASSTERICTSSQEVASTNSLPEPSISDSYPRVFKEFDFLEAEHDSVSETAESCFGWLSTMRPTSLGESRRDEADVDDDEDSESAQANSEGGGATSRLSRTSQCSSEERTPCPSELDDELNDEEDGHSIPMEESSTQRQISPQTASSLGFLKRSTQDLCLEEASIDGSSIIGTRSVEYYPNQPAPLPLIVQCAHHCDSRIDQQWANLISDVPDDSEGDVTSSAILLATQMFRTSCSRVMTLLREANLIFGLKPLSKALSSGQDSLARVADCPFIFVTAQFLRGSGLMQRLKFSLYEMKEHVETFNERKEHCLRMLNSVRSAYKLSSLGGSTASLNGQNENELARLLSKTFFQLMQMNDALHHMLQLFEEAPLLSCTRCPQPYWIIIGNCSRTCQTVIPGSNYLPGHQSSFRNEFSGDSLVLLMANKRYSQALQTVRQLRLSLDGEFGCCDQTDIDVLLLLFCRSHTLKAWALVGAASDAMRRQSDLLRNANADLAAATTARRLTVDQTPQRTSTVSSLNESFSKLSYHPDI